LLRERKRYLASGREDGEKGNRKKGEEKAFFRKEKIHNDFQG